MHGNRVIITSHNMQTVDVQAFLSQGIAPASCRALVVKSQQHFRGSFTPIADHVLSVDSGGAVSPDLKRLRYANVRRPVWPLDDAVVFEPVMLELATYPFRWVSNPTPSP